MGARSDGFWCPGGFTWRCVLKLGAFLRAALPDGGKLPEANWHRRHAAILVLAWAQVAFIPIFGIARGESYQHSFQEGMLVALPALVATFSSLGRKVRACAATFSLLGASGVLTHLSGGSIEMHFHFFVMLAVISIYQDWTPFLLAIGFVLVHHGLVGALDPTSVYNHPAAQEHPWKWAAIHALFVSGSCLVSIAVWKFNERAREEVEESYRLLYEGEHAIVTQLMETQRAKEELMSIVSHEFRTPVTSIYGFAKLLSMKSESLTIDERQEFYGRVMNQSERLKLMVDNLLSAASPIDPELGSKTNLVRSVASVVDLLSDRAPKKGMWFEVNVPSELEVGIGSEPLQLVLMNLVSNAVKYGDDGTPIVVHASNGMPLDSDPNKQAVSISVTNRGIAIPSDERERVFEPFVQLDSSSTRAVGGVGLGLHIVRRVVDASAGSVDVTGENGSIIFTVKLPVAGDYATAS